MALLRSNRDNGNGTAPKPERHKATITASARRVRLGQRQAEAKAALRGVPTKQPWHDDAWDVFDVVPEVKHGVWFTGNAMAKLSIFPAVRVAQDRDPIPVDDPDSGVPSDLAASAIAELARLEAADGGIPGLLQALNMNLEVTGLAYLVGRGAREAGVGPDGQPTAATPERWAIHSVDEVEVKVEVSSAGDQVIAKVRTSPGAPQESLDSDADTFTPIWQRHPRWAGLPDCHMRAVITDARALQRLTGQVLAESASAMPAQILTMPNELSFVELPNPTVDEEDPTGDDGESVPADVGEPAPDPLDEALDEHLAAAIEDPSSFETVRPLVLRGPAEYLKPDYVRTIDLSREADAAIESKIAARVDRVAHGMNLPVEVVLGHMQTTFANAEQVDEDTFEDYLEPRCELIVDAWTHAYLRPNMLDAYGVEQADGTVVVPTATQEAIGRIIVWYDASRLRASADTNAGADEALRNFAISLAAYRKAKGFSEDDAPEPLELLITAGLRRGILTAELTKALLELLGEPIDVEALPAATPQEAAAARRHAEQERLLAGLEMIEAATGPASANRIVNAAAREVTRRADNPNPGARLLEIDVDLRNRLLVAADSAVGRALELAGARLKAAPGPTRAALRSTPPRLRAATLGRSVVESMVADGDVASLLDGAFDELGRQFMTWGARAQEEALGVVDRIVGGFTADERRALGLRQADDLAEGWRWMEGQLRALSEARLFTPDPAAPDLGEFDATLRVPSGMVRQAVARSGGAAAVTTDGTSAYVALVDDGTRPPGGIGTGELLRGEMRDRGALVEAYRWVYGPAMRTRPFEPHEALDGEVFVNFDDPILANGEGFPATAFYLPGDHAGCICDVEPIIATLDELDE